MTLKWRIVGARLDEGDTTLEEDIAILAHLIELSLVNHEFYESAKKARLIVEKYGGTDFYS